MPEASSLKPRQYLANGLPVIQAYEDTDIEDDSPCVLHLPNTEDNRVNNIGRIRDFDLEAHKSEGMSQAALTLARGHLSIRAKERLRLQFFDECLRNNRRT